jgi:DNA polymerase I-like protein with 3'-5' exonuclease and polymerase domains
VLLIYNIINKHKLDAKILLWVHDEIVDKVNDNLLLSENNKVVTTLLPHKFIKFLKTFSEVKRSIMVEVANRFK